MPASLRIENLDAIGRIHARVQALGDAGRKVIPRSIVTLKRRLQPLAKRDIANQYNLPASEIGKRLLVTADDTSVTLTALGRTLTLSKFGARQNAAGVAVQIEKGRTLQIDHAFIRVPRGAPSAGWQVLIRSAAFSFAVLPDGVIDIAVVDHNRHGYPIVLLGALAVADMLRFGDREGRLIEASRDVFAAEVDRLSEVAENGR
jgi:hypothetical protein